MTLLDSIKAHKITLIKGIAVALVCLFGLLFALYYAENFSKMVESYSPDEGNYIAMAKRLINEGYYSYWGYGPDAYVTPGFPIFLVICMTIFGTTLEAIHCIKIVQAVLFALTVLLTYLLGVFLTKKFSVGLIASILIATNGSFCFYSRYLLTETLYFFTMMLSFVVFVLAMQKRKLWLFALAGICFSVCVLVRPLIFVVIPFIFIPHLIQSWKKWKELILPIALFSAGFLVVILPWWIRNLVTMDQFILFATQTNPIYAGLAPNVSALGIEDPGTMMGNIKLLFRLLLEHPWDTFYWMTFGKFEVMFMNSIDIPYYRIIAAFVKDIAVYVGLFSALFALFSKKLRWPAVAFWAFFLSSFLFIPTLRYSLQYLPLLTIFAGDLLVNAFPKLQFKRKQLPDNN